MDTRRPLTALLLVVLALVVSVSTARAQEPSTPTTLTPPTTGCHVAYSGCVPGGAVDVDCAGGAGDGPAFALGRVLLAGPADPYGLDGDGDGIGCEAGDPTAASVAPTTAPPTAVTTAEVLAATDPTAAPTTTVPAAVAVGELAETGPAGVAWLVVAAVVLMAAGGGFSRSGRLRRV